MCNTEHKTYYEGFFRGIQVLKELIQNLKEDEREDLIKNMMDDTELTSLLLKKYELIETDEYEFLSDKADEEWEECKEEPVDMERQLRILLLEKLSEDCEDELYSQVAMGIDDELFYNLLKKYKIQ